MSEDRMEVQTEMQIQMKGSLGAHSKVTIIYLDLQHQKWKSPKIWNLIRASLARHIYAQSHELSSQRRLPMHRPMP